MKLLEVKRLGSLSALRLLVSLFSLFPCRMTKRSSPKKAYPPKFCTNRRVSNLAAAGQRQSLFLISLRYWGFCLTVRLVNILLGTTLKCKCGFAVSFNSLWVYSQGELSVAIFTTFNWRPGLSPLPVNIVNFQSDCLQKHTLAFFTKTFFYWALS